MRSLLPALATAAATMVAVAAAVSDVFSIAAVYTGSDGKRVTLPTWYGDGHMYVGSSVPAAVRTAFNYTANTTRSDLLYIHATDPLLPTSSQAALDLPDPTFLALNAGSSSSGSPLEFRHDAVGLSDDWILFFARYGTLILAQTPSGQLQSSFYLSPSPATSDGDDAGASIITWGQSPAAASAGTAQLVSLYAMA
ncbi:hypothetical protein F4809DRAFT_124937 [Biscogniauxia mediterranea]|nr:hypothetical protein F4809DRAFT_124937 [Biscogniauxia mediterranea]